jgi:hypothetical protein
LSGEQKQVSVRIALFVIALVAMILLAGFGFPTDKSTKSANDGANISISKTE